jgi:hypothetical protein
MTKICLLINGLGARNTDIVDIKTALGVDATVPVVVMHIGRLNPMNMPADAEVGGIIIAGRHEEIADGLRVLFPATKIVALVDEMPSVELPDIAYATNTYEAALEIEETIRVEALNSNELTPDGFIDANAIEDKPIAAVA